MLILRSTESAASNDSTPTHTAFVTDTGAVFLTSILGGKQNIQVGFPYSPSRFQGKGAAEMLLFLIKKHIHIVANMEEPLPWRNTSLRSIWLPENGISDGLKDRDGLVGEKALDAVSFSSLPQRRWRLEILSHKA